MNVRKAGINDLSRVAEIYVFNNRVNFFPIFKDEGIGSELIEYAVKELHADHLWALEKNIRAISFYQRHGFHLTDQKRFEEGTTECLIKLEREYCL